MKKALILYASYSGNTAKVAKTFQTVLEEFGWGVDMLKVTKRTDKRNLPYRMDDYDLLLAGSPIMAGRPAQEVLECICPEMFHEMHFFSTHENYSKKGIAFVTYGGSGRGPAEAMPSLAYIKMCMEDVRIKSIGQFACCGKEFKHMAIDGLAKQKGWTHEVASGTLARYIENPKAEEFQSYTPGEIESMEMAAADPRDLPVYVDQNGIPAVDRCHMWHWDSQNRPTDRDLLKARIFLSEILEDYYMDAKEEFAPLAEYLCIG